MTEQSFRLPVEPVAKGRPRVVRLKSGMSHTFTPDKTVDAEERIRWHLKAQGAVRFGAEVPLRVVAVFQVRRPKSIPKKRVWPIGRPDVDQYLKLLLDACNQILWHDDSYVVALYGRKEYTEGEGQIILEVMEEED